MGYMMKNWLQQTLNRQMYTVELQQLAQQRPFAPNPNPRNPSEKTGTMPMPVVLQSPLRPDLVREVHRDMAKNKRRTNGWSGKGKKHDPLPGGE